MGAKIPLRQKVIIIISALFLFFILLEMGLRLAGFVFLSLQEYRNKISLKQRGAYRIMCLGESTTAWGGKYSYPSQLEEIINARNIGIRFSVINKAVPGTTAAYILQQLEDNLNRYKPDMVTTMMGINDILKVIPSEGLNSPESVNFLRSFRIYKLAQLLKLHIVAKAKRLDNVRSNIYIKDDTELLDLDSFKTEASHRKAIKLNPDNDDAYVRLGWYFKKQRKFTKAEELFKKAIELNPKNYSAYIALGQMYKNQGKFTQAEEAFKKAIGLNPGNYEAYVEIGHFYGSQGKFTQAEESYKKADELNPRNYGINLALGWCYKDQGKFTQAEETLKRVVALNPNNDGAYLELGRYYIEQGKFTQAEESLKKAIGLNPGNYEAYVELGRCYWEEGESSQAEESLKRAIELNRGNDKIYAMLALLHEELGKYKSTEEYYKKADEIRAGYYSHLSRNYQKLKEILDRRKIKLICMQYPMRNIEPLKRIFEGQKGVIFVDNEKIFKERVKQESYKKYFVDIFGGDFGHCTPEGNRLLAENIADVILKENFNK